MRAGFGDDLRHQAFSGCVMTVGVSWIKAGALIATLTGVGAFLVFSANGSMGQTAAAVPASPFGTGQGPSELIADVSALMIVVDGHAGADELAFAQSLADKPEMLISGQGLWPVDQQMVKGFSKEKYRQQLEADLAAFNRESMGSSWSANKISSAASEILASAKAVGPGESSAMLVSAASSVWSKQTFEQAGLDETHENAKQRERVNLRF
jgi:hypothetical protein